MGLESTPVYEECLMLSAKFQRLPYPFSLPFFLISIFNRLIF
jgi:hypothetical protein